MKIWRYNACFCCLNCLPGGRQFASLRLMFSLGIFKSMQNTAHSPATNRRLLPDLTRHELAHAFLLIRDKFRISNILDSGSFMFMLMLINSKYIVFAEHF